MHIKKIKKIPNVQQCEEEQSTLQGVPHRQNWDTGGHPVGRGEAYRGLFINYYSTAPWYTYTE